jgi:hypothetical protein
MEDLRAFLAHAKGDDPNAIADMTRRAALALRLIAHGRSVVVTSGISDWERHFSRCGSWPAWARDVAQGVDYLSREPRYHTFIVPTERVGAGTAQVIQGALGVGKPVLRLDEESLTVVTECEKVAQGDWKTGWVCR